MASVLGRLAQRVNFRQVLRKQGALLTTPVRTLAHKDFLEILPDTPAPWPYRTKRYRWYHSTLNLDKTIWRINENSKVILVEGNIGVGKSTFAKDLADQLGMLYVPEPNFSDYYDFAIGFDLRKYKDVLPFTAQHFEIEEFYNDPNNWHTGSMQCNKYIARWVKYIESLVHLFSTGKI